MPLELFPMLDHPHCLLREVELLARIVVLEHDLDTERAHSDRWQKLAGCYDEMRYSLRNHDYTAEGCRQFYDECAELIFGDNPG